MTLVARFTVSGFPLLIGDLLVSSPPSGRSITIPTVGDPACLFPPGSEFVPSGLCQKVVVLGDNLAIGWAGSQLAARIVLTELAERSRERPFTKDALMAYFEAVPEDVWQLGDGVGFVGFIKDEHGVAQFGFHYENLETRTFGRCGLLGTGADQAERFLQQFSFLPEQIQAAPHALARALGFGLVASGTFLSNELTTYTSLFDYFGAGYEIISLVEGRFQKIQEITLLFWQGEMSRAGMGLNLHHVEKYSYHGDFLVIRGGTLSAFSSQTRQVLTSSLHVVPPPHLWLTDAIRQAIKPSAMESPWLCNYLYVRAEDGRAGVHAVVSHAARSPRPIQFHEEGEKLIVAFEQQWLEGMVREAYRTF